MQKKEPRIGIVILSYNTSQYTTKCVESILEKITYENYEILIINNGSKPEHSDPLKLLCQNKVSYIELSDNHGYGGGMNEGIKFFLMNQIKEFDYLFLLNDDTIIKEPDMLQKMLKPFELYDSVGIVSPMTNYAAFKTQDIKHWGGKPHGKYMEVDDMVFVAVLIKKQVFDDIGIFDERFKLGGYEDNDFSIRLKKNNWRLVIDGKSFIFHYGSAASSVLKNENIDYWENLKINKKKLEAKWGIKDFDEYGWQKDFYTPVKEKMLKEV